MDKCEAENDPKCLACDKLTICSKAIDIEIRQECPGPGHMSENKYPGQDIILTRMNKNQGTATRCPVCSEQQWTNTTLVEHIVGHITISSKIEEMTCNNCGLILKFMKSKLCDMESSAEINLTPPPDKCAETIKVRFVDVGYDQPRIIEENHD